MIQNIKCIFFHFNRVALSHSSSAGFISDVHSSGNDDAHVSLWREVLPGEEIPFEFEAREKLRHRYSLNFVTVPGLYHCFSLCSLWAFAEGLTVNFVVMQVNQ